jgi:hypothetical protein
MPVLCRYRRPEWFVAIVPLSFVPVSFVPLSFVPLSFVPLSFDDDYGSKLGTVVPNVALGRDELSQPA